MERACLSGGEYDGHPAPVCGRGGQDQGVGRGAVAARHGSLENRRVALFTPLKPMLATAETSPEAVAQRVGPELWIEDKFDGIRAQAHRSEERVAIFSRDLKEVSAQFPEVVEALRKLP